MPSSAQIPLVENTSGAVSDSLRAPHRWRWWLKLLAPLLALAYFLPLAWPGLFVRFAYDDMYNIAWYWSRGWAKLLIGQVHFFSTYYRPMGGLFYLPILEWAGMNPFPYRAGILAFLTANVLLAYNAGRLLSRSRVIGLMAAIGTCYHSAQLDLHNSTSQLYDVLCFFFWFAALNWYLKIRLRGGFLRGRDIAVLLVLYVCAMNSKEMGVTLPVLLLAFEVAFFRGFGDLKGAALRTAVVRTALPIAILGLATLAFVIGKQTGPDALALIPAYRPLFTVGRFLDSNAWHAHELLYQPKSIGKDGILLFWLVLGFIAWRRPRPYLRWAWALIFFGATPIAFLPQRGAGCMYIPLFGYGLFAAALLNDVGRWFSREAFVKWFGCRRTWVRLAVLAVGVTVYGGHLYKIRDERAPLWAQTQDKTWSMLQQMEKLRTQFKPAAKVVFLDDPFADWDMYFITQVIVRDHAMEIVLQRKMDRPLTAAELAGFDHVLTVSNGKLLKIR